MKPITILTTALQLAAVSSIAVPTDTLVGRDIVFVEKRSGPLHNQTIEVEYITRSELEARAPPGWFDLIISGPCMLCTRAAARTAGFGRGNPIRPGALQGVMWGAFQAGRAGCAAACSAKLTAWIPQLDPTGQVAVVKEVEQTEQAWISDITLLQPWQADFRM